LTTLLIIKQKRKSYQGVWTIINDHQIQQKLNAK